MTGQFKPIEVSKHEVVSVERLITYLYDNGISVSDIEE